MCAPMQPARRGSLSGPCPNRGTLRVALKMFLRTPNGNRIPVAHQILAGSQRDLRWRIECRDGSLIPSSCGVNTSESTTYASADTRAPDDTGAFRRMSWLDRTGEG